MDPSTSTVNSQQGPAEYLDASVLPEPASDHDPASESPFTGCPDLQAMPEPFMDSYIASMPDLPPVPPRTGPPPDTKIALSQWSERLPSLPEITSPAEGDPEFSKLRADYLTVSAEWGEAEWQNPHRNMFDPSPFLWADGPDSVFYTSPDDPKALTVVSMAHPDPQFDAVIPREHSKQLPQLDVSILRSLEEVKMIHSTQTGWAFRGFLHGNYCFLKLFSSEEESVCKFEDELSAYTHLINHKGSLPFVPQAFGWFSISSDLLIGPERLPWVENMTDALPTEGDCRLLMTEYIPGKPLCTANITPKLATQALLALAAVHEAQVLHNDIVPEHFLVSAGTGRVVLIDFDVSASAPDESVNLLYMWREMRDCWEMLFQGLLPDKYVGIERDFSYGP